MDILNYIRDAYSLVPAAIGGGNYKRTIEATASVGVDKHGQETNIITILTDVGGKIITAFPGADGYEMPF